MTRRRPWWPCRRGPIRVHLERHVVARRDRARPTGHLGGGENRQLHERARGRRPDPLPPQCRGTLAPAGVAARLVRHGGRARADTHCSAKQQHCRVEGRSSTSTTLISSPRATCPNGSCSRPACRGRPRRRPPPRPSAASSTLWPPPTPPPSIRSSALCGLDVGTIHLVGGGSQNALLCRLTADSAHRAVEAGPRKQLRSAMPSSRPGHPAHCRMISTRSARRSHGSNHPPRYVPGQP